MDVWHHQMFGDASPLAAEGINYHVLLAPGDEDDDVVTCEVHFGDNTANVYETKGQLGVLLPISEDEASDANHLYQTILGISRLCIAGEFNWELRTRTEIEGPFAFSTDPRQSIYHAPAWHRRLDAGVFDGRMYVLLYKRKAQLIGLEGGKWFDKEFRLRLSKGTQ